MSVNSDFISQFKDLAFRKTDPAALQENDPDFEKLKSIHTFFCSQITPEGDILNDAEMETLKNKFEVQEIPLDLQKLILEYATVDNLAGFHYLLPPAVIQSYSLKVLIQLDCNTYVDQIKMNWGQKDPTEYLWVNIYRLVIAKSSLQELEPLALPTDSIVHQAAHKTATVFEKILFIIAKFMQIFGAILIKVMAVTMLIFSIYQKRANVSDASNLVKEIMSLSLDNACAATGQALESCQNFVRARRINISLAQREQMWVQYICAY